MTVNGETFERPITLAVLAMGGQGGGVLADWIIEVAEEQGWYAQGSSVPGVAQRTGATVYYIEMLPARDGKPPVLSLIPTRGDVDIVLAAEFVEAGRSMLQGLVTPDRTALIASTHRVFAVLEKQLPGDGVIDSNTILDATGIAAKKAILFDMQALAERAGSHISATMLGALAGSGLLPFPKEAFLHVIGGDHRASQANLDAFEGGYSQAKEPIPYVVEGHVKTMASLPASVGVPVLDDLLQRIRRDFPEAVHSMLYAGVKRLTDYQDVAYAHEYLSRVAKLCELDPHASEWQQESLTFAAAKYIAVAMSYDDVIRVADLKTRSTRVGRIDREVGKKSDQLMYLTEFMHPRMEEIAGTMPAALGAWIESKPKLFQWLDKLVNRGRRVQTGTVFWFMTLYLVSALKPIRRRLLRHRNEQLHIANWLQVAHDVVWTDYDLAVEVLATRQLVKGYSDTHARGNSKFDKLMAIVPFLVGKPDASGWLRRLRTAALADEDGKALDGSILTVRTAFEAPQGA
ncbi:indolepyruvate oxidoreductase subunit beta family protein [Ferrovibrio sp.]|uniref:indolepyruvate oxidoreductase subunit beta family protein n=1 Tax=Ferrovibrio sp. TaxID=1917215 RepID=UPI002636FD72|nr:indolepyruvate oxidoreductase subunit beta family protein [Ferrovibrio sp.]